MQEQANEAARRAGLQVKAAKIVPRKGLLRTRGVLFEVGPGSFDAKTGTLTIAVSPTALKHPKGFRLLQTGFSRPRGKERSPAALERYAAEVRARILAAGQHPRKIRPLVKLLVAASVVTGDLSATRGARRGLERSLMEKFGRPPNRVRIGDAVDRIVREPKVARHWLALGTTLREEQGKVPTDEAIQLLDAFARLDFPVRATLVEARDLVRPQSIGLRLAFSVGAPRDEVHKQLSDKPRELDRIVSGLREALTHRSRRDLVQILGKWAQRRLAQAEPGGQVHAEAGNKTELVRAAPQIADMVLDPHKGNALLEVLSVVRTVVDGEDGLTEGLSIPIGPNLSLRVDTGSFRKHRLICTNGSGEPTAVAEIKMVGDLPPKRFVSPADYHLAQELRNAPGLEGRVRTATSVLNYGLGARNRYGQRVQFSAQVPERIVVSLRNPKEPHPRRLTEYLTATPPSDREARSIVRQVGEILHGITSNGWTGDGDLRTLHNFEVVRTAAGPHVWLVNDFAAYKPIQDLGDADKALQSRRNLAALLSVKLPHVDISALLPTPHELREAALAHIAPETRTRAGVPTG